MGENVAPDTIFTHCQNCAKYTRVWEVSDSKYLCLDCYRLLVEVATRKPDPEEGKDAPA